MSFEGSHSGLRRRTNAVQTFYTYVHSRRGCPGWCSSIHPNTRHKRVLVRTAYTDTVRWNRYSSVEDRPLSEYFLSHCTRTLSIIHHCHLFVHSFYFYLSDPRVHGNRKATHRNKNTLTNVKTMVYKTIYRDTIELLWFFRQVLNRNLWLCNTVLAVGSFSSIETAVALIVINNVLTTLFSVWTGDQFTRCSATISKRWHRTQNWRKDRFAWMNHISSSQLQNVICSRWLHVHKLCLSTSF